MDIIQDRIFMLACLILIGYVAEKTGYLKNIAQTISKIITRITLPLLVITTLSAQGFDAYTAGGAGITALVAAVVIGVMLVFGHIISRVLRLGKEKADVHTCLSAFGNVIFIGYSLIGAIYGERGIFYAAFYALVNDCMLWTLGVLIISRESGSRLDFKKLVNPSTISFTIGLVMYFFGLKLPGVVGEAASAVASTTVPLSMIFIGSTLAAINLKSMGGDLACLLLAVQKMVLAPVIAYFILAGLNLVFHISVESMVVPIIVLEAAMPCQTVFAIMISEYKSDTQYAALCIFVTTILSLITLPVVYRLIV